MEAYCICEILAGTGQRLTKRKISLLRMAGGESHGLVVKNPPANVRDAGLIPGLGRSPGEGNGNPLQYSAWRTLWTEEPGRLQSMESQRVRHN